MNLTRLYHTTKYLKPIQIRARLFARVRRKRPDLSPAPILRERRGDWTRWNWRSNSLRPDGSFDFLGRNAFPAGWDDPELPRLWRYNLHYFDDLNAVGAPDRIESHDELIARWIAENAPGEGTGWEPYPTSLRIVNWIKFALTAKRGATLDGTVLHSLAVQTRWLQAHIEWHLLGNHLWANAKCLAFAGAFFDGPEANGWLEQAEDIFRRELNEQILPDGGHFERSPMYHAILLEDVLDLINLSSVFPKIFAKDLIGSLHETAPRMLRWLRVMTHPDGDVSLFNDAAFDIAPRYQQVRAYALQLGVEADDSPLDELEILPDSGFVRLQNNRAVVICDVGDVGPDYLPGHAHADSLSFELSVDGRRIFVNGGTSTYEAGPARDQQRGTAAHNTVVIDNQNSTEVWHAFRVARRARPFDVAWGVNDHGPWLSAAHDGYRRLRQSTIHRRRWTLTAGHLTVEDQIDGLTEHATGFFHCHPDVHVAELEQHRAVLQTPFVELRCSESGSLRLQESQWHPRFGTSLDSESIVVKFESAFVQSKVSW